MRKIGKITILTLLCSIFVTSCVFNSFALEADNLSAGTYSVSSTLSCYVNAMGGVEFGESLLTGSTLNVDGKGNKSMTLNFTKSIVTIYNITCDTFIDPAPSSEDSKQGIENGTIGYYDKNGELQTNSVKHTLSDDTALNSKNEQVKYVNSITFPLDSIKDTYELTMYINSNVMGVQFGTGGSSSYPATLTVDWDTLKVGSAGVEKDEQYDTLPSEAKKPQATTEIVTEDNKDNDTVEKDGLNIHYANDNDNTNKADLQYKAYMNMPTIYVMMGIAVALIVVGVVLIIVSKYKRKDRDK